MTGAIIPVYNEEKTVYSVIKSAEEFVEVVIVVNDGSTDSTALEILKTEAVLVSIKNNQGKGAAIKEGLKKAKELGVAKVVVLDGDGQHKTSSIKAFFKRLEKADIVIGRRRFVGSSMPISRRFSNFLSSIAVSILAGVRIYDSQCGFRGLDVNRALEINVISNKFEYESEFIIKASKKGLVIDHLPIETVYSDNNNSKMKPLIDLFRFIMMYLKLFIKC